MKLAEFENGYVLIKMNRNNSRDRWHIQLKGKQPMCDHGCNLIDSDVVEYQGLNIPSSEKICGKCVNNTLSVIKYKNREHDREQELREYAIKNAIRLRN